MILNPDKFEAIVLNKYRSSNTELKFIIGSKQIQVVPSVDILNITIDDKLSFNLHIDKICLKSTNQLNALVRLKRFLGNEEKKSSEIVFCSFRLQLLKKTSGLDVNKCEICT